MVNGFRLWYSSSYLRYSDIVPFLARGTLSSAGRLALPFTLACLAFQPSATRDSSAVSSSLRESFTVLLLLATGCSSPPALLALSEKLCERSRRAIFFICKCVSFFRRIAKISVSHYRSLGSAFLAYLAAMSLAKTEGNLRSLFSQSSSLPPGGRFSLS